MNVLISKGSISDEQAARMKILNSAQCILSRDLSALTVSVEVGLNQLRRKEVLTHSTLDPQLQERLLTLPVDERHLFADKAANKMVADFSTTPAGVVSTLSQLGSRFHPYATSRRARLQSQSQT